MIILEQAIELAKNAHKNQWRNSTPLTPNKYESQAEYLRHCGKGKLELPNGNYLQINAENEFEIVKPYITHPLAVMNMMGTEEEKIVAILHDVFEMCEGYALGKVMDNSKFYIKVRETLKEFTISQTVYDALVALSKYPSDIYEEYIKELAKHKLAVKIKIADMMHNMSESNNPEQKEKYLKALPILLKAL